MFRKLFRVSLLILTLVLISSCEAIGKNEFLPDSCKTYNQFINLSSKEFYSALKSNNIDINKRNYFDVLANTKTLKIDSTQYIGDFSLSGLECFQYLNQLELNGKAINNITPLKNLTRVEKLMINNTRVNSLDSLSNMVKITELTVNNTKTLRSLKGIETLTKLEVVNLGNNALVDISKIAGLPNIKELTINNNELTSIDILDTLPKLVVLDARSNKINFNEIDSFTGFKNLQVLNLKNNQICKTKALGSFTGLISLDLSENNLSNHLGVPTCQESEVDFSFLGSTASLNILIADGNHLTSLSTLQNVNINNLTHLSFRNNEITSIGPIADNSSLGDTLTNLYLANNKITGAERIHSLKELTILELNKNEIKDINDVFLLPKVTKLYLSENKIKAVPSLVGKLTQLNELDLSNNDITSLYNFKDNNSLVTVDLSFNKITEIKDSFSDMSKLTTLSLISDILVDLNRVNVISKIENSFINTPQLIFKDQNLKLPYYTKNLEIINSFKALPQIIKVELNKILLNEIDENSLDLPNVTEVYVNENNLTHIKWTNNLPNLVKLEAEQNAISLNNFIPKYFDKIKELNLGYNDITESSALSYLTNVIDLKLTRNHITNTAFLNSNPSLKFLNLSNNALTDTSGIVNLNLLEKLYINNNQIVLLSGLVNLPALKTLDFSENLITSIDGLSQLGVSALDFNNFSLTSISENSFRGNKIKELNLNYKTLSDLKFAKNLTYLEKLYLEGVGVADISPLSGLTNLKVLNLSNNWISNIDPLRNLVNLETLDLSSNNITSNKLSTDQSKYVIENFRALKELRLETNDILELNGLNDLTSLQRLSIDSEKIIVVKNSLANVNQLLSINYHQLSSQNVLAIFTNTKVFENSFNASPFDKLVFPYNYGRNISIKNSFGYVKNLEFNQTVFNNDNIDFINHLTNLESLTFIQNSLITSLKNIDSLGKLKSVAVIGSILVSIENSFNNCADLTDVIISGDSLTISNSFNSAKNLELNLKGLTISGSLSNLNSLNLVETHNFDLNFIKPLSKLTALLFSNVNYDEFELDISQLTNLKTIYFSNSNLKLIRNSFNNSQSLTSLNLGLSNFYTISNSFNDLPNLSLPNGTLSFKTSGFNTLDTISNSFNNTKGFTTLNINNQQLAIKNSFSNTEVNNLQFIRPSLIKELSGFNNTNLESLPFVQLESLESISGFKGARFYEITFVGTKTIDLKLIDKTNLNRIYLNNVTMTDQELVNLIKDAPNLKDLTVLNTTSDISWLSVDILNNLQSININQVDGQLYAAFLAKKRTNTIVFVRIVSYENLRQALLNEINNNADYLIELVGAYKPDYKGDPTKDNTLKLEIVSKYLLKRYSISGIIYD